MWNKQPACQIHTVSIYLDLRLSELTESSSQTERDSVNELWMYAPNDMTPKIIEHQHTQVAWVGRPKGKPEQEGSYEGIFDIKEMYATEKTRPENGF